MAQDNKKIKKYNNYSFEESLEELEKIISDIENGNMKIDVMIQRFEDAQMLSSICQNKLNLLKQKVELLMKDSAAGQEWKDIDVPDAE